MPTSLGIASSHGAVFRQKHLFPVSISKSRVVRPFRLHPRQTQPRTLLRTRLNIQFRRRLPLRILHLIQLPIQLRRLRLRHGQLHIQRPPHLRPQTTYPHVMRSGQSVAAMAGMAQLAARMAASARGSTLGIHNVDRHHKEQTLPVVHFGVSVVVRTGREPCAAVATASARKLVLGIRSVYRLGRSCCSRRQKVVPQGLHHEALKCTGLIPRTRCCCKTGNF